MTGSSFRKCAVVSVLSVLLLSSLASAWEKISWQSRSLDAGKVDIATQFYSYKTVLGKANFSPELAFPLEAVYDSGSDQTGMLGYRWKAVQLESRVFPRENGAEWVTPWGEKIAFYTKEKPTAEMLEVFRDQMKGRGCFSPYADWQALGAKGNWVIAGTKKYQGWSFVYSNSQLAKVTAPTGRSLSFNYVGDKLVSVEQNGVKFIELNYGKNRQLAGITINGVKVSFDFTAVNTLRLPEKVDQKAATLRRSELASIARGTLTPVELGYDKSGYLSSIKMGTVTELLDVEHESSYDRLSYLKAVENAAKEKMHTSEIEKLRTKVDGRLLADRNFTYSYPDKNTVDVKNKQGQTAKYSYNGDTGILNIVNFAGLSQTVYYFRRYDVAYNGNLRQIKDAKGRIVANYRYDHKSGNLVRVRDMMDNEIHYSYDKQNRLELVSRMEESATNPMRPLVRFGYDAQGNPDSVSMLAPDGKAVNTVKYFYDKNRNVTKIDSGANFTRFNYTPFGLPDRISDTFDRTQKLKYDTYNRVVEATNFYGVRTTYSYDKNGLLSEIIRYAPGKEKQAVASVTLTRNPAGEIISMTDHANLTKKFDRSAEGRIIAEYFPNQTSVHYQYTDLGQISNVQDANRNPINFAYSKFGSVASTVTAAGQKTSYDYDQYGLLTGVKSGFEKSHKADRNVKYTYDQYDRLTKADYGNGFSQEYSYDRFGKILQTKAVSPANTKTVTMTYDDFDRVIRKTEDVTGSDKPQLTIYEFVYNPDGRRKSVDVSFQDGTAHRSTYSYDKYGRLTRLSQNDKTVQYEYDKFSRVSRQIVNGTPITFMYTATGQLESKAVGTDIRPLGVLKYTYSPDGQIASREVNGRVDKFGYNALGQLVTVKDGASGVVLESYKYDPAGNILSKTIGGQITTYTYDKANQLISSTAPDGTETKYEYDGAGRMVKEGSKTYTYGWRDKVLNVSENGVVTARYDYHADGQLASVDKNGKAEEFFWDGLALIKRGGTSYVNEPAVTGGNPVLATNDKSEKVLFNDMLGSTMGSVSGKDYKAVDMTLFGESKTEDEDTFFTGKPEVDGLGYAFAFRNYRFSLGKWQTADPLGYPDGWNNKAYVNNKVVNLSDPLGLVSEKGGTPYIEIETGSGNTYSGYVESLADLNYIMLSLTNCGVDKITDFTFMGHGTDCGYANLLVNDNEGIFPQNMSDIFSPYFDNEVNISLIACYQGRYLDDWKEIWPDATVTGYTGTITFVPPMSLGIYWGSGDGEWVTE